jgi:MoxR-like ATPase
MRGRDYVLPHDVAELAPDVLSHRLVLTFDAVAEGVDPREIVSYVLSCVPAPRVAAHGDPQARDHRPVGSPV